MANNSNNDLVLELFPSNILGDLEGAVDLIPTIPDDPETPPTTPPTPPDTEAPTSTVDVLPSSVSPEFRVTWYGFDNGDSGVASYDIFVSTDGGEYVLWQNDTTALSAIYPGESDRDYEFYSVATDNAGNTETTSEGQASTTTNGNSQQPAIYRLLNTDTGVHLYTSDVAERNNVIQNLSNYQYEGVSYFAAQSDRGVPVYRFYERNLDIFLYTASEAERDSILENLPNYELQGESFTVFESQVEGTIPVYRFFIPDSGAFFYTASEVERDSIVANLPNYTFEGVAFYGFPLDGNFTPIGPDSDPDSEPDVPDPDITPDPDRTGFSGAELTYQEFSPNLDTPFGDPFNIVVGEGAELDIADGELSETGIGGIVDLTNGTLTYEVNTSQPPGTYAPAEFNGFIVADLTDNLPTITNVVIDPASTLAVDDADVVFIDDALAINVENVPFADGDFVRLNVDFAEPGTEPPEPDSPVAPPTGNSGNFTGAEIQYQVFFPDLESAVGDSLFATVGDGAEFTIPPSPDDDTSIGETIDITGNSIIYEVTEANGSYTEGEFNGIVFADTANNLPAITNVTIDSANTSLGIDNSDIVFIEDAISINLAGLPYVTGDTFKLDVEFADV